MEVPEFFQGSYCSQISAEKAHYSLDSNTKTNAATGGGGGGGDHFIVEELLDFSNEDAVVLTDNNNAPAFDNVTGGNSTESSTTVVDSCNSSSFSGCDPGDNNGCRNNFSDGHFSSDLCVPYDDLADLEWLSKLEEEESFSCEDLQKLQLISGMKARSKESSETREFQPETNRNVNSNPNNPIFNPEMAVPGKARSKRSRAAPCNWASRLQLLCPTASSSSSSSSEPEIIPTGLHMPPPPPQIKKSVKAAGSSKKKVGGDEDNGEGRRCLHCATDKTPQWRTGPMGPKTLCNACGVRYKSGRLVPEYRPAASPTFVLTKHSNSHRKVLELRRQKEMLRTQQHQQQQQFMHHHHQNMMFDLTNGDDYLIHHQHVGPSFRQLI